LALQAADEPFQAVIVSWVAEDRSPDSQKPALQDRAEGRQVFIACKGLNLVARGGAPQRATSLPRP